jgi:glycosyltransferase involved in cell wall biosynthesis
MKSENEFITVGMPVYNGEENLEKAIVSILSQTFTHFELIIGDDYSTDTSRKIYEKFAKKDKRIKIFRHKNNIGPIANFNFVLQKAKGNYFIWAAQDDIRDKHAFKKLISLFHRFPEAVLAVSHYQNLYKEKKYTVFPKEEINNNQTILESLIRFLKSGNLSFFYGMHRTENLQKAGGYFIDSRPFFKSSDFITIFKVLLHGKFVYTPEILFYKRDTGLFTEQYSIIKNLKFDAVFFRKVNRYLFFPLFYFYDLFYGTYFVAVNSFSFNEKIIIEWYLILSTIKKLFGFLGSVLKGMIQLLHGLFNKI